MNSSAFDSGRQFETDPISGQLFFREPIEGFYSPWRALEPSDYHIPTGPASHSVSALSNISFLYLPVVSLQMLAPNLVHPTRLMQGVPYPPSHAPPPGKMVSHSQGQEALRTTRRSTRAHDPIRGRGIKSHEGGKGGGRTRGSANYRPREIEVLLDLAEAELPVGAKGWNTVGTKFREWAATTENSSRTDRSLEAKYKQACPSCSIHTS